MFKCHREKWQDTETLQTLTHSPSAQLREAESFWFIRHRSNSWVLEASSLTWTGVSCVKSILCCSFLFELVLSSYSVRSSALKVIQGYEGTSCPWRNVWQAAGDICLLIPSPASFFSSFPQGWKWHNPACFWVGEESVTFNNARRVCASYNATLVVINNRYSIVQISAK